jgi:hypothetical protein
MRLKTAAVVDLCTMIDLDDSMQLPPYGEAVHTRQPTRYFAVA